MSITPGSEHHVLHHRPPNAGIVSTRQPVRPYAKDEEAQPEGYEAEALAQFAEGLEGLARAAENRSNPVDEYNSAALSGAGSSASVSVQPTYEYMPEKIESIIVTGPAGNISLQIGDRIWALSIPTTGVLVIAPLALLLSRSDPRTLTPATPGIYTLELMGIADRRFKI